MLSVCAKLCVKLTSKTFSELFFESAESLKYPLESLSSNSHLTTKLDDPSEKSAHTASHIAPSLQTICLFELFPLSKTNRLCFKTEPFFKQYPSEVPGVVNADFLKAAINAHREKPVKLFEFYRELESASKKMNISMDMAQRYLNEGFSGGEKKRNEILQMLLLKPSIAMLDEIDSGLDVDALVTVSKAINEMQNSERAFLVVSHYARLYGLINPTRAAVMINGKIALDGGPELIERIDKDGYEWIQYELGISVKKEDTQMNTVSIGTCGVKDALTKGGK